MDFRGRVYPIPPHLSHLGSDLSRSLLVFALKKPLGPNGLDWLKVHVINLTGLKKREPIKNRLIYANKILDKILDSAENPLTVSYF
jgi:DNA-directed RNA polymerase